MTDNRFNPSIHVTAGQLRKNRVAIPRHIPDRAWIRKTDVSPLPLTFEADGKQLHGLVARFASPFYIERPAQ